MATTENTTTGNREVAAPANVAPSTRGATLVMIVICAAVFLTALDQTVVVTALAPIADSYHLDVTKDLAHLSWVVSGYLLGYVIVMPLMGRVSDLYGRRRILFACLGLFALGSLLCVEARALSELFPFSFFHDIQIGEPAALSWLVLARFVQAVGGGAVIPVAIAAIGDLYGNRRRVLALGVIGGITEAGGALGPLYGAFILQRWNWHITGLDSDWSAHFLTFDQNWQWIFILNLPLVALIALGLIVFWPRNAAVAPAARGRIDWLGAVILGGALLCASLGLGQQAGAIGSFKDVGTTPTAQNNPLLIIAAVVLLGLFIFVEARQREPVIHLDLFRRGAFSASAIFSFLLGAALIVALVDIPIYILTVTNASDYLDAGLALLRMTVMIPLGAFGGGWLVARFGSRVIGAVGAGTTAIGFVIMHTWSTPLNWTAVTFGTLIAGLGFGLIVAPISTTALNTTTPARFGMASSVVTALRMVGMILGLAALSAWGVGQYTYRANHITIPPDIAGDVVKTFQYTIAQQTVIAVQIVTGLFLAGAVIAALAIIPALFLWQPKPGEKQGSGEVAVFSMGL